MARRSSDTSDLRSHQYQQGRDVFSASGQTNEGAWPPRTPKKQGGYSLPPTPPSGSPYPQSGWPPPPSSLPPQFPHTPPPSAHPIRYPQTGWHPSSGYPPPPKYPYTPPPSAPSHRYPQSGWPPSPTSPPTFPLMRPDRLPPASSRRQTESLADLHKSLKEKGENFVLAMREWESRERRSASPPRPSASQGPQKVNPRMRDLLPPIRLPEEVDDEDDVVVTSSASPSSRKPLKTRRNTDREMDDLVRSMEAGAGGMDDYGTSDDDMPKSHAGDAGDLWK